MTGRGLRAAAAVLAVLALPLLAALLGSRAGRPLVLNLGPGDAPYVAGFAPEYEIDDKVGTHWTTYHAAIALPVAVEGDGAALAYRLSRVYPETALVEVAFAGRTVDRFECRGGAIVERAVALGAVPPTGVTVRFDADSHERKDRGVKLDWVRLEVPHGTVRLTGLARWQPALLVAIAVLLFVSAGWTPARAAGLAALPALVLSIGLFLDPWTTHRMLRGIPLALALFGGAGIAVGRWRIARGAASADAVRILAALGVLTFLLRAAAVSHPDFYYPDQRTHARLVEKVQEKGLGFFARPSEAIAEHGVWRTEAYGKTYAFPYTPAFHLPFAALDLPYDTRLVAMKLTAAALSIVPMILVWALARRFGVSTASAFLMALIPTYTSRLAFAFLPALLGHAVDIGFLYWLSSRLDRVTDRRAWMGAAAWVTACQLAYVSGVINVGMLVAMLAAVTLIAGSGAAALALVTAGLAGSAVSVLLYYRDFLPMFADVAGRMAGGAARAPSRYPVESFFKVAWARTRDFFDGLYPVLTALGVPLLCRGERWSPRTRLVIAWLLAYAGLLLGRAKAPDLFLHGHETLFVTPLVCLAAGAALGALAARGGLRRFAAALLLAALAVQGLLGQWAAIAEQLANAR